MGEGLSNSRAPESPQVGQNILQGATDALSSILSWETAQGIAKRAGALGGGCLVGGAIGAIAGSAAGGVGAAPGALAGCKIGGELVGAYLSFEVAWNTAEAGYRTVKDGFELLTVDGKLKEAAAQQFGHDAVNFGALLFARRIGKALEGPPPALKLGAEAAKKVVGEKAGGGDIVLQPLGALKDGTIVYGVPTAAAPVLAPAASLNLPIRPAGSLLGPSSAAAPLAAALDAGVRTGAGAGLIKRGPELGSSPLPFGVSVPTAQEILSGSIDSVEQKLLRAKRNLDAAVGGNIEAAAHLRFSGRSEDRLRGLLDSKSSAGNSPSGSGSINVSGPFIEHQEGLRPYPLKPAAEIASGFIDAANYSLGYAYPFAAEKSRWKQGGMLIVHDNYPTGLRETGTAGRFGKADVNITPESFQRDVAAVIPAERIAPYAQGLEQIAAERAQIRGGGKYSEQAMARWQELGRRELALKEAYGIAVTAEGLQAVVDNRRAFPRENNPALTRSIAETKKRFPGE